MMSGGNQTGSSGAGQRGGGWMNRPRLREDLMAEAIEDGGQEFIDLIDPSTGETTRLYYVEYSLACGMDGQRDVASLSRWATQELGLTPSEAELRAVIAALGERGYLDEAVGVAAAPAAVPKTGPTASMAIAVPAEEAVDEFDSGTSTIVGDASSLAAVARTSTLASAAPPPGAASFSAPPVVARVEAPRVQEEHDEFDSSTATSVASEELVNALSSSGRMEALAPPLTSSMPAPAITRTRTSTATPAPMYGVDPASEVELEVPEGLVRRVVSAAKPAPDESVEEFELGHMTPSAAPFTDSLDPAPSFDLGHAGTSETDMPAAAAGADFGLGAPGLAATEPNPILEVPVATAVYAPQMDDSYEDPFEEPPDTFVGAGAEDKAKSQADTWVADAPVPPPPAGDSFDGLLDGPPSGAVAASASSSTSGRSRPAAFDDEPVPPPAHAAVGQSLEMDADDDDFETDTPAVNFGHLQGQGSYAGAVDDDMTVAPPASYGRLATSQSLLDDDMTVSASDVKAAVRKSQVIQIPLQEAPDNVDVELEDMTVMAPPSARPQSQLGADSGNDDATVAFLDADNDDVVSDEAFAQAPMAGADDARQLGQAATMYAPPVALPLPSQPASRTAAHAAAKAAPKQVPAKLIMGLVVLAIVAAAAYFAYQHFVAGKQSASTGAPQLSNEPPPPPAPATATLVEAQPVATKLVATQDGVVAVNVAVGAAVKAGDAVAKLEGFAKIEKQLGSANDGIIYDIEKRYPADIRALQEKVKQAETSGNGPLAQQIGSQLAAREAKLAEATKKRDEIAKELAAFVAKAPTDAKATEIAKVGTAVKAGDALVTLESLPAYSHTLTLPASIAPGKYAAGTKISLVAVPGPGSGECDVIGVDGQTLQVVCPKDALAAGATVQLPR